MTRVSDASTIKRPRRTKAAIQAHRAAISEIVEENQPCSDRQVYYLGIGTLWDKDKGTSRRNYNAVVYNLGVMRENSSIPWSWITDATRYCRIPTMYESIEHCLERTAEEYRRNLWSHQSRRVEVWAESDSVSGIIDPVTRALGVGLFSCRGQASKTFAWSSARNYQQIGKPVTIYYCGDWDPSGLAIPKSLEERLNRYAGEDIEIDFRRLALTIDDVRTGDLTTHAVNTRDKNYTAYADACRLHGIDPSTSTEVEALAPPVLRQRLEDQLYDLVDDAHAWNTTLDIEENDREYLRSLLTGGSS